MKTKIEFVANVVVILLAVVIGIVFIKDRFAPSSAGPIEVKAGDKLAKIDGLDFGANDETLLLVLRKGCHFCEDSAPFYQRLVTQQKQSGSHASIVAVFPDAADVAKEVVQSEGLGVQAISGVPLEKLNVNGTPTLLLVDSTGKVLKAWMGMLSPRQELEVIKATGCNGGSCREPA
jgi:thioredoxin-related protein